MVMDHLVFADNAVYVCLAPVLLDSSFWIFVVTMLLDTKSLLNVTKQLVFIFSHK